MKRFALLLALATGCADTGQSYVDLPVTGAGVPNAPFTVGAWTVTLTRADVAFGPAYFCATAAASVSLCETAVAELRESGTLDGLDPTPMDLGTLHGTTGIVRSALYDLGISFFLTEASRMPTEGAVDGHSARFAGHAENGGTVFDFVADVDVEPPRPGVSAVHGAPTVQPVEPGVALEVRVDPIAWWQRVDFDALAAVPHAPGEPVVVTKGSIAYDVLIQSMTSHDPPSFTWSGP